MLVVAGLTLRQLQPRVWDSTSPYYLPMLKAIMVSYADFHRVPSHYRKATEQGLHAFLGVPKTVKIYLDNGAFYFLSHDGKVPKKDYEQFVKLAKPDWYPIPQDFIPTPQMQMKQQRQCFTKTMYVNRQYEHDGYTPVIHISRFLEQYTTAIESHKKLSSKTSIALGGIVPNLLRSPKSLPHQEILNHVRYVRQVFKKKSIHVFGVGGTATLHLAMLLGIDSADSSGWRNRAARGIIQLPGIGDRMVADLGSWRGRKLDSHERRVLQSCQCPACMQYGMKGIKSTGVFGFSNRATHNLWVLLEEQKWINHHLSQGTYSTYYKTHLNNSIYRPLIDDLLKRDETKD